MELCNFERLVGLLMSKSRPSMSTLRNKTVETIKRPNNVIFMNKL